MLASNKIIQTIKDDSSFHGTRTEPSARRFHILGSHTSSHRSCSSRPCRCDQQVVADANLVGSCSRMPEEACQLH